jgi:uncharacterized protein with HEPN domain
MRDDRLYLVDILEAAAAIDRFIAGMNEDEWIEDEVHQSAVMHQLIIVGEAASHLPRTFQLRHPEIEWADIVGFRNFAIHAYFAVSWSIVWVTATADVPALATKIAQILAEEYPSMETQLL